MTELRLTACAAMSIAMHVALVVVLTRMPEAQRPRPVSNAVVRIVEAPAPPPEPPPPEPVVDQPVVHDVPHSRPANAPQVEAAPNNAPAPDHPTVVTDTTEQPVFGVTMESTSQNATGSPVPTGNTTRTQPGSGSAQPRSLAAVAEYEATKLPMPEARCFGKYTDEARQAGIEGTVVLDLVVSEDGHARDITVATGLPHGLTAAAIEALRGCRFSPGEKDGKPVAVKIRGFKIHFVLQTAD